MDPDYDFLNLFAKGDPATTMYVVRSGALQVHDGNVIYETVGPGGILVKWRSSMARRAAPVSAPST